MDEPDDLAREEERLLDLAVAIADGTPIDWSGDGQPRATSSTPEQTPLTRSLRQLECIVRGHSQVRESVGPAIPAATSRAAETLLTEARHAAASPAAHPLRVEWGPLIVLDKIGRGSFGDVYRAWDPRLHREVALKLVPATSAQVATPAFEEGRLLARIRHPNVVTVYGAERVDDRVGIWMEYVRGRTLADEIAESGPVSAEDAARVGIEVCRALSAVHGAGLLHRDVKAQNVLREADGRIVLGDFGTGIELDENAGVSEPQIAGTPLYLAPEILTGGAASTATDIYSVGVLLYFLVTGQYPTRGRTLKEVRRAHSAGLRVPLRDARPDLPAAFVQIVEALVEPGPDRRYGSAAAAEAALQSWLSHDAVPHGTPAHQRHRGLRLTAIVLVAGVGVAALVPGVRGRIRTWAAASFLGVGAPISRQILNAPCIGQPSADGQWIACVEDNSHLRDRGGVPPAPLVIFNVGTGETRVVKQPAAQERITSALISPDGRMLAFTLVVPRNPVEFRTIAADGSAERLVTALPADVTAMGLNEWSAHDQQIVSRIWRKGSPHVAALASPVSGALDVIYEFDSPPQGLSRSPDGGLLAFDVLQSPDQPERDIRVCDLATRACETVAAHPAIDVMPSWAPDGRLLFNSDRAGTMGLWAVELSGLRQTAAPELVRDTGRGRMTPRGFGPDGLFFYTLTFGDFDVFSAAFDSPTGRELTPVRLSPRAVDVNRSPVWSPDGQSIAYISRRGPFVERGAMRLVIQSLVDGREREFRYGVPANMTRLAWSPDGRILAMRTMMHSQFGIHLLDPADGRLLKILRRQQPPERFVEDQISDIAWIDQSTIAFASQGGLGVFDIASGAERRIWDAPAATIVHGMALSPDRRWTAVAISDGEPPGWSWFAVAALPSSGGPLRELLRVKRPDVLWAQTWTNDAQSVLVTRWDSSLPIDRQRPRLWQVPFDGGAPSPLPLALPGLSELRMHPDGRRLAFTAGGQQSEFWMQTIR